MTSSWLIKALIFSMTTITHTAVVINFPGGVPAKQVLRGAVKHHFDDKFLANKGIDF